jgi:hypothetical protein
MSEAIYLYCIADGNEEINFGSIGLEKNEVYTIPYKDLCAVVHDCSSEPYKSDDKERVRTWIMAHEKGIEAAWAKFGSVLPLGFDTIIHGNKDQNAENNIKKWLNEDYKNLRQKLNKLIDRAEFGVQIFWDPKTVVKALFTKDEEIKKLNEEIRYRPKGLAYMYKQKLENLIRKRMEIEAERYFKDFFERIRGCVDEIKVEKSKKSEEGKDMLMNLSCLLPKGKSQILGEELEKIDRRDEFSVRFTGPWPPYSFV